MRPGLSASVAVMVALTSAGCGSSGAPPSTSPASSGSQATNGETSVSPSTTKTSDVTLSAYNQPVRITAPAGAITIPGLGGATA